MGEQRPLNERILVWAIKKCDEALNEAYTTRTGWNLKCPHCNHWAHTKGFKLASWSDKQTRYECLSCGKTSAWHFEGPFAHTVPIEYFGVVMATTKAAGEDGG